MVPSRGSDELRILTDVLFVLGLLQEKNEESVGAGSEIPVHKRIPHPNGDAEDQRRGLPGLEVDPAFAELRQDVCHSSQSVAGQRSVQVLHHVSQDTCRLPVFQFQRENNIRERLGILGTWK